MAILPILAGGSKMALKPLGLQRMNLDFGQRVIDTYNINNADVKTRGLEVHVLSGGLAYDCTGVTLRLYVRTKSLNVYESVSATVGGATGVFEVLFPEGISSGMATGEIILSNTTETIGSFQFSVNVINSLTSDATISQAPGAGILLDVVQNEPLRVIAEDAREDAEAERVIDFNTMIANGYIVPQEPVSTFDNLATTYPNPIIGWTSKTLNDSKLYRWDGTKWKWIDTVTASVFDALLSQLADNAINLMHPIVPLMVPKGDGVTDDTLAIQNILNYAGLNNKSVEVPDKTFLVTGLNSGGCKCIFGHGENSVIKSITNTSVFVLSSDNTKIDNVTLIGNSTLPAQKGININGYFNCSVTNCTFKDFGYDGIYLRDIGTSARGIHDGATISGNHFYNCERGIECDTNAEYVNIVNNVFQEGCAWAIWTIAGNTLIDGNNITKCNNGIYLGNAGNGGHGIISDNTINHIFTDNGNDTYTTGYALFVDGITLGENITSNAIFDAHIMLKNCNGIRIDNCNLAIVEYRFANADGCTIENNILYKEYGHVIKNEHDGLPSFVQWTNNKNYDGSHGSPSEEILGGQVKGTLVGQTVATDTEAAIAITASVNSANYPNNAKYASSWWNGTDSMAINRGKGGNKIKFNIRFSCQTAVGGSVQDIMAYLYIGTETIYLPCSYYVTPRIVFFNFSGEIPVELATGIQLRLWNKSGQTVTVNNDGSMIIIEGL